MSFLDPRTLLTSFGYLGLFCIIFAESGLFFGFFFPGDSLLLTAGLFASEGQLNIWFLLPLVFVAAVLGDNVGYWFGRKTGPPLFTRPESLLFKPKNLLAAKAFYDKHGSNEPDSGSPAGVYGEEPSKLEPIKLEEGKTVEIVLAFDDSFTIP